MTHRVRLGLAVAAAAAVVLAAPFIGQMRGALEAALPSAYRAILVTVVGAAVAAALVAALAAIRERRLLRYAGLGAALAIGGSYVLAMSTGNAAVDAVERFHFVEYGLLTVLFYRAWAARNDIGTLVLPAAAAFVTGVADEAMQWFVPLRVGEFHDVALNGVAIGCGLLFALAAFPPERLSLAIDRRRGRLLATAATAAALPCALFVDAVHLGVEVRDADVGTFRSNVEAEELLAAAADRAARWSVEPPVAVRRLSREDQYLNQALWHVQKRNEAWAANDYATAWRENRIVEKFFAPVLMTRTYATPNGARWPEEQRAAAAAAAAAGDDGHYVSRANPYPIYAWSRAVYWSVVAGMLALTWVVCLTLPASASTRSIAPSIT